MTPAVAVFVKTPGISPIKTRLAATLGEAFARHLYEMSAAAVSEAVSAAGLPAYWAVAEAGAEARWTGRPVIRQGPGGLGRRMAAVHTRLVKAHGAGILIGADMPAIHGADLRRAADMLAEPDSGPVLGPAADGGFWLFGAARDYPESCWRTVAYSRADTAARFRQAMDSDARWRMLDTRTDIDRPADLAPALAELEAVPGGPAQQALIEWLKSRKVA